MSASRYMHISSDVHFKPSSQDLLDPLETHRVVYETLEQIITTHVYNHVELAISYHELPRDRAWHIQ